MSIREATVKKWKLGIAVVVLVVLGAYLGNCAFNRDKPDQEVNVEAASDVTFWTQVPVEFSLAGSSCGNTPGGGGCVIPQITCTQACGNFCAMGTFGTCQCDANYNGIRNLQGECATFDCETVWLLWPGFCPG